MHAARCCTITPPQLCWNDVIESVVCAECSRVWAPVVLDVDEVDKIATIRGIVLARGVKADAEDSLGINRHAVRRRLEKHGLRYGEPIVNPYAPPGPTSEEMAG